MGQVAGFWLENTGGTSSPTQAESHKAGRVTNSVSRFAGLTSWIRLGCPVTTAGHMTQRRRQRHYMPPKSGIRPRTHRLPVHSRADRSCRNWVRSPP